MVASDIDTSNAAVASSMTNSPNRRSRGTNSTMTGASRLPAGIPNAAQQKVSAAMTLAPDFGDRGVRGRIACRSAPRSALRA